MAGIKKRTGVTDFEKEIKKCLQCNIFKPFSSYQGTKITKLSVYCAECRQTAEFKEKRRKIASNYYKNNKNKEYERSRKYNLWKIYNITIEDFNYLLELQNYSCAICSKSETELNKRLNIDHDHKTGKVRGLLCSNCNTALGLLYDNPELISKSLAYINKEHNINEKLQLKNN